MADVKAPRARKLQLVMIPEVAYGVDRFASAKLETTLTGTHNDLLYTAKASGTAGNSITITYVVSGTGTTLSIGVVGSDITVNVATDGGGLATSTASQVKTAVEASAAASALVAVELASGNDGTGIVTALSSTPLAGGSAAGGTYVAGNIIPAQDINPTIDIEEIEILSTSGHLGRQLSGQGVERGGVTFRLERRGKLAAYSASVRPEWHYPHHGCGLIGALDATPASEKWTYTPNDTPESMTIYLVAHITGTTGIAVRLVGCFGDVETTIRAGQVVDSRYTFQGLIAGIDAVTYVPGSIVAIQYPVAKSAQFQIGTENYAPRIADITLRLGNILQPLPSVNSVGGIAGYFIADRKPMVTINPEVDAVANYDWYTKFRASTTADCTFQAGSTQYNRILFDFARLQVVRLGWPQRDGIVAVNAEMLSTIASGNDDWKEIAS